MDEVNGEIRVMSGEDLPGMLSAMLPRLWGFALRLSGDEYDAEELVHKASLRALKRVHQLDAGTSPLSLMFYYDLFRLGQ
jgi:RNA polymerase sigma-70 factor (ECF subfamily)